MYIPRHFEEKDRSRIIQFMKDFPFATLVSNGPESPFATHIPTVLVQEEEGILIQSHLAAANPHLDLLKNQKRHLLIYAEPHAYISPSAYTTRNSVPTWNFVAVHAYGPVEVIEDRDRKVGVLEASFRAFDDSYFEQWSGLDPNYREKLLSGMTAFEMREPHLEAKFKLSQNRNPKERQQVIDRLARSGNDMDRLLAKFMKGGE